MVMMTYQIPDEIKNVAAKGEFDEFDLNTFFSTEGKNKEAVFKYENEVQKCREIGRASCRERV